MLNSYVTNQWGDIFGLKTIDLSIELLKKISFEKLLECLENDSRVPHIISARMLNESVEKIKYIHRIPINIILKFPNIVSIYNRYLEKNSKIIDKQSGYYRKYIVLWHMLNENNRKIEIERWMYKIPSIINENSIDYSWLYTTYPDTANRLTKEMWKQEGIYKYNQSGIKHMIRNIPKHRIKNDISRVFKSKDKHLHLEALGNPHLPEEYITKALKIVAKRTNIPIIKATITKKILEDLPTITRLEVIEKLISSKTKIRGIKDKDEFRMLFLGSIMRYPQRVEYIVNRFDKIWSKNNE